MADQNIQKAQKYLNNMYGHRKEWVTLGEDGITGSLLCQGLIRAFQIENNVSPVTGVVGNATLNKMRSLPTVSKMEPSDASNPNVCILQCALFAKGFNAGGITGIYYTTGVNAVKQYQAYANLEQTGIIDWKVWMGLISLNWFNKTNGGDVNVRTIQRQLNADWSDIIGVGPCDGVVSRFTAYAMIAALQAAEGIYTDFMGSLDGTNFGAQTTNKFPNVLKQGQNGSYVKYNKLVQYGLYLNGYNPKRFDGNFDSTTKSLVTDFQEFYALTGIGLVTPGEVNCATMKSLLTSKGDTSRKSKACDCSNVLNAQQALDLKAAGYQVVGRYLTGTVGGSTRKFITFEEIKNIKNAGLRVFPIYQDGGYKLQYFQDLRQGIVDAHTAIAAAKRIGIPSGTTIYFAVDFDCYGFQMISFIVPYFRKLKMIFNSLTNTKNYKIGIYAPRYICTYISDLGLAEYSFVADMSSGFSCNLGYPIPKNWAFDQFFELNSSNGGKFNSSPDFDLDKVGYSGRDSGISNFDDVKYLSPDQLADRNESVLNDVQRDQYAYNVFEPLGYLDRITNAGISYEGEEIKLETIHLSGLDIEVTSKITSDYVFKSDGKPITISLNNDGTLSSACEASIENITANVELGNFEGLDIINTTLDNLKDVAVSITSGQIGFKVELDEVFPKLSFIIGTEDIFPDTDSVNEGITIEIGFKIIPKPDINNNFEFNWELVENTSVSAGVILIILACIAAGAYYLIPGLLGVVA
ncbi:glycoside hydrolase domain-containing protein [Thomasclavelia cocleata]|jgi:peptidoglycan hydrolase-like protein with peptidoglycan-binding domain|uniref:glycoside hydrolase domain-containing protein n=1 Tax=Thomasclavelia cocleata TaxID=69824 RepID=UPI00241F1FB4|nr:glycoside hydrolase domain-containing protein [Thomasclavelia cocleata]